MLTIKIISFLILISAFILLAYIFLKGKKNNKIKFQNKKIDTDKAVKNFKEFTGEEKYADLPYFTDKIDRKTRLNFENSIKRANKFLSNIDEFKEIGNKDKVNFKSAFKHLNKLSEWQSNTQNVNIKNLNKYYDGLGTAYQKYFIQGTSNYIKGLTDGEESLYEKGVVQIFNWKKWLYNNVENINKKAADDFIIKYKNPNYNFSMSIPRNYYQIINENETFTAMGPKQIISITVKNRNNNLSYDKQLDIAAKEKIESQLELYDIGEKKFQDHFKSKYIISSELINDKKMVSSSYIFIHDDYIYDLTLKMIEKEDLDMEQFHLGMGLLNTFSILEG